MKCLTPQFNVPMSGTMHTRRGLHIIPLMSHSNDKKDVGKKTRNMNANHIREEGNSTHNNKENNFIGHL